MNDRFLGDLETNNSGVNFNSLWKLNCFVPTLNTSIVIPLPKHCFLIQTELNMTPPLKILIKCYKFKNFCDHSSSFAFLFKTACRVPPVLVLGTGGSVVKNKPAVQET